MSTQSSPIYERVNIGDWCAHHNLNYAFLDFEYTKFNPVEVLETINDYLATIKDSTQFIRAPEISDRVDSIDQFNGRSVKKLTVLMSIFGVWKPPKNLPGKNVAYLNPNYTHLDHLGDEFFLTSEEERDEYLNISLGHGLVQQNDIATAFNIKESSVKQLVHHKKPYTWSERRSDGLERTAKSWKTLAEWGYEYKRLAPAFNINYNTFKTTIYNHTSTDFEPPQRPSHTPSAQQQFGFDTTPPNAT